MRLLFILVSALAFCGIANAQPQNASQAPSNPVEVPRPNLISPPPPPLAIHMPCGLTNFGPRPTSLGKFATNPTYPPRALADGINQARLVIDVTVNERGRVASVEVMSSTAPGYFEEAAISDALTMRFQPAMTDCRPSTGHYRRAITYRVP